MQRPSRIEPLQGERPWLHARIMPFSYRDYILPVETPGGGGAYLEAGPALSASYVNVLRDFFHLSLQSTTGADQLAVVDFDRIEFSSTARELAPGAGGMRRAHLSMRLRHEVPITTEDRALIINVPVDVSAEADVEYEGERDYIERASELAAELFLRLEEDMLRHLVAAGEEDRFIMHYMR